MKRTATGAIGLAVACTVAAGVAGWRLGWFSRGTTTSVASPAGGEPVAWSATVERSFESNGTTTTAVSRFARDGDRMRLEWDEGGRRMVLLVRPDLGVRWLVDFEKGAYTETPLTGPATPGEDGAEAPLSATEIELTVEAGAPADAFAARRERIDDDTLDGHRCAVYRSRLEALDGTTAESTVWEAVDLGGLALRSEIRGSSGTVARTVLRDLSRNPPPDTFELPPGVRKSGQTP
ncbi:MAG: hypothetical protein IT175_04190 [Acidobacteria bacterium]|nr:hypothetical protein [Acidobacteriota bacterium]